MVDDGDFPWLSKFRWWTHSRVYATGWANGKNVLMHRLILSTPPGMESDHINGDRLDNRRDNLRICTLQQNQFNSKVQKNNHSGVKGVYWWPRDRNWRVCFFQNGKQENLGYYNDKVEAISVYNKAIISARGAYAKPNYT